VKPSPAIGYVAPFAAFLGLLALSRALPWPDLPVQSGFVAIMLAVIAILARPLLKTPGIFRVQNWTGSLLAGIVVFILWIGPDLLFPGYRHHWLFENPLTGTVQPGLSSDARAQAAILWLRAFRAVAIVPIVEELFWRGWLMRWLINADFLAVPLGTWSAFAFWGVAILFASEHGAFWDVGLIAGVIYNWWMLRTRSLGDLILAHAVTNACLCLYVVIAGKWEYWG
jgi:CAAX prenyl protease-like protein